MRGMSRQTKSVIAFLAAIFCVVSMLVAWARFGGVFFLVVAPVLGVAAFRLVQVGWCGDKCGGPIGWELPTPKGEQEGHRRREADNEDREDMPLARAAVPSIAMPESADAHADSAGDRGGD